MDFRKVFFSLPAKLIFITIGTFLFGDFLSTNIQSAFLTASMLLKEILVFILPIIVFFLVFSSFADLSGGFLAFTGLLLFLVCFSNFSAVMLAYPIGLLTQDFIATNVVATGEMPDLHPYFTLHMPKICDNSTALIIAILFGVVASTKDSKRMKKIANNGANIVNKFLAKIFTPLLPIFICGFIMKAQHDRLLSILLKNFLPLLSVVLILFITYIGLLYFVICKFNIGRMLGALKNILPASIVGFSSMSSAAAMPVLIDGASKNAEDKNVPKSIVSFITNTHMMGDALAIPLMAMSLYIVEYNQMPDIGMYFIFGIGYMMAKFASAGIPGGTILIMTPVLESHLGFTSEMSSIILTTYLLFDPFCTCGSIFGNGAFAMLFERLKNIILPTEDTSIVEDVPLLKNEIEQ